MGEVADGGSQGSNMLEDPQNLIDDGLIVPVLPGDNVTADGLELWRDSPPLYHDFTFPSYVHFDVKEWTSRIKKYKFEVVTQADRIRRLEPQVQALRRQLATHSDDFQGMDEEIGAVAEEQAELLEAIGLEKQRKANFMQDIMTLKRNRAATKSALDMVNAEIASCTKRIGHLKEEVDENRRHFEMALGEKERLNLERQFFFRERLLLEETTAQESMDTEIILESLERLRHTMHAAWKEAKETDVLGHLRATKLTPSDDSWFAARRRNFVRSRSGGGTPSYRLAGSVGSVESMIEEVEE